jgi:hypothetical protein
VKKQIPCIPVLSLIACSRNDDYFGSAIWRLQTALNLTARAVHEMGLQNEVEIILTDWGSETPLRKALHLTPEAASLLSVIDVPRTTAERYQLDSPFSEVHALNSAARRSRGLYIGRIDQDTVLGRHFLQTFFALHRGEQSTGVPLESAVMLASRRSIPFRFTSLRPPVRVMERFIQWFGRCLPLPRTHPEHLYYQSFVGIWLIHRDLWHRIGGYDESFIYMNWMEADMILRLETTNPFINLGRLVDHDIYHLDHIHPLAHWRTRRRVRRNNPVRNHANLPPCTFPNKADWGLASEPLKLAPYVLRPEEGERALREMHNPARTMFVIFLIRFSTYWLMDRLILASLYIGRAGARLVFRLSPRLREPCQAYYNAVRGHFFTQWPKLLHAERTQRRAARFTHE